MDTPPPLLTSALELGEKLIWWERLQGGIVFRGMDGYLIPFSIVWTSAAGVGGARGLPSPQFAPQAAIPILFVAIGAYLVVGRFFYDAWRRGRTVYGLTDRRILIVRPSKLVSLSLEGLSEMSLTERRSGRGSIAFGPSSGGAGWNRQGPWSGEPRVPTFEFIPEARKVQAAIRDAQKKAAR